MDNNEMLHEITQEKAFKSILTPTLGSSIIQPAYRNEFIKAATRNQTIFNEARRILMTSNIENIDQTGFQDRIMEKAVENKEPHMKNPYFKQHQLIAEEYIALTGITDQALRRNIETEKYASTLIQMMGEKFGEDFETLAVGGDKDKYGKDSLLQTKDGWIKKCTNKIKLESNDAENETVQMLSGLLRKYPKNYMKNRSDLRFYLNSYIFDKYLSEVGERATNAGDEIIFSGVAKPYKGVPVIEATVLNDEEIKNPETGYGEVAMLMNPNNMIYGIFHEITMEQDRLPKLRKTDYIITTEVDMGYENPDVGVIGFLDPKKK